MLQSTQNPKHHRNQTSRDDRRQRPTFYQQISASMLSANRPTNTATTKFQRLFSVLLCCFCFLLSSTGCVQRRLLINSQPEGALVSVDKTQVGHTPVAVPFTYYGTREIQLQKDGFKTVYVKERVRPPWYGVFPISLISENFAFREIRDHRALNFELTPKDRVVEGQLLERADQLRTDVQRGTVVAPLK